MQFNQTNNNVGNVNNHGTPDPSATTTTTAAPGRIQQAVSTAQSFVHDQVARLEHLLSSSTVTTEVAAVANVAEAVFAVALPAALSAEVPSVAALLTPAQWQALAALVGEINATVVRQFLARVPHADAAPAKAP